MGKYCLSQLPFNSPISNSNRVSPYYCSKSRYGMQDNLGISEYMIPLPLHHLHIELFVQVVHQVRHSRRC